MKKTADKNKQVVLANDITRSLDDIMSDRFGRYSKYIIQERALPDARDGLKPVQRRILYAMNEAGNTYDKPHRKSAKTVGIVIGTYHPHGDTSVYDAMVRMSQDWKMNLPLIDMKGNNGGIDDDPPAAMRYTEARLSPYADLLLEDIDKDTVAMTNNYDDTELEPTVLPAKFPLLMVNGATGIASGYATNIAPHNLGEIIDATIYRLYHPDCSLDDLLVFVKGPDFPTGGIVQGKENIREVFKTGKGKVVVRSKCDIVLGKTINQIVISEIPYEVVKKNLVKKLDEIRLNKDIEGIIDVRDESGRDGLRIVIDLKKDIDAAQVLNYFYKNTDLQINYAYNMIAIVNHAPVLMNLITALDAFIEHRKEVSINACTYLKNKKEARIHIIEGLIKAISILDDVLAIIRSSKDKEDAIKRLCEAYLFTKAQAEAIVMMRLYRLSNTDITILKSEYASLVKEVAELTAILSSPALLNQKIINELNDVKKQFPTPRKTKVEDEVSDLVVNKEAMIANEEVFISVSKDGYIKRCSMRAYQANEGSLTSFKEEDCLLGFTTSLSLYNLLLFTDRGNYAYIPIYELAESKWKDLGQHFSHYFKVDDAERIVSAMIVDNFQSFVYVVTVTAKGLIKKTLLNEFKVQRSTKTMTAMRLKDDDRLLKAFIALKDDKFLLASSKGYYNYYAGSEVAPLATKAMGIYAMDLKDDVLADALAINENDESLLIMSDKGSFKRIRLNELPMTNRRTKGLRLYKWIKSNPHMLKKIICIKGDETLYVYDGNLHLLHGKDVPYMSIDATFSSPLSIKMPFFAFGEKDFVKVPFVEFPQDEALEKTDDQLTLF